MFIWKICSIRIWVLNLRAYFNKMDAYLAQPSSKDVAYNARTPNDRKGILVVVQPLHWLHSPIFRCLLDASMILRLRETSTGSVELNFLDLIQMQSKLQRKFIQFNFYSFLWVHISSMTTWWVRKISESHWNQMVFSTYLPQKMTTMFDFGHFSCFYSKQVSLMSVANE